MNRIKSERGLTTLALVGIVVLVAGIAGGGWYVLNSRGSDSRPLTAEEQAASDATRAACKAQVDDDDFCEFASNWDRSDAYTMVMTSTTAQGSFVSTFKSDGNGNISSETDFGGGKSSTITIGNATYVRDETDGSWFKYVNDNTGVAQDPIDSINFDFNDVGTAEETLGSTVSYNRVGTETCGDLTCIRYKIVDSSTPDVETFILFDEVDHRMRRSIVNTAEGSTDTVITYGNVTITEPSPVKEVPSYDL